MSNQHSKKQLDKIKSLGLTLSDFRSSSGKDDLLIMDLYFGKFYYLYIYKDGVMRLAYDAKDDPDKEEYEHLSGFKNVSNKEVLTIIKLRNFQ